jgi:hypothetical protein
MCQGPNVSGRIEIGYSGWPWPLTLSKEEPARLVPFGGSGNLWLISGKNRPQQVLCTPTSVLVPFSYSIVVGNKVCTCVVCRSDGMPICSPISVAIDQSEMLRESPNTLFRAASMFRDGYLLFSRTDRICLPDSADGGDPGKGKRSYTTWSEYSLRKRSGNCNTVVYWPALYT